MPAIKIIPVSLCLLIFTLSTLSCGKQPEVYEEQSFVFGTIVDIVIAGEQQATAAAATKAVMEDFEFMHGAWQPWENSALARINSLLPLNGRFTVAPSVLPLIVRGKELYRETDGLFNPAIGKLVQIWGFNDSAAFRTAPPPEQTINEYLQDIPTMDDVELLGIEAIGRNKNLVLDFGGFAKGVAVDRAIERLRELGINNAIVNAGGDLRAIGQRNDRPWRIGIRHPRNEGVIASLDIKGDESVFTSGDYERFFDYEGRRYHHILDPRTGYPAQGISSVTVIYPDSAKADAAATALMIAGEGGWRDLAAKLKLDKVMLVTTNNKILLTPAMRDRLVFNDINGFELEVVTNQ